MKRSEKQQGKGSKKRVLVIEDEPVITRVCERVLTAEGFDVDVAANGNIAKDMIAEQDYDLCISDVRTPEMNGIEFYRYLQERQSPLVDKVIFTTGDVLSEDIKNFLAEVNRPFLPKPFTPDDLSSAVQNAFQDTDERDFGSCGETAD